MRYTRLFLFLMFVAIAAACSYGQRDGSPVVPATAVAAGQADGAAPQETVFLPTVVTPDGSATVTLYLTMAQDGNGRCTFGEVSDCRLFRWQTTMSRDPQDGSVSFSVVDNTFAEILPDVPAVMPAVSPDGKLLVFMAAADSGGYQLRQLYVYNLETGQTLPLTDGQTHNDLGQWPRWLSDRQIVYSNFNDCADTPGGPGCAPGSRYQDAVIATLNEAGDAVLSTELIFGDVNPLTGLDSTACAAEDPAPVPGDPNLIIFHSTSVDGQTAVHDGSACPWLAGMSGQAGTGNAAPVVLRLDAAASDNSVTGLTPGADYWLFDLAGAGIDGCAHPDAGPDGRTIVCTEQGSTQPYRECSDPAVSGPACQQQGYYGILYNRMFGFTLQGDVYGNVRQDDPAAPLFRHLHPSQLPTAGRLWPTEQPCNTYLTKYAELGPESLLLATVLCRGEQEAGATSFSRLMLIEFADPENPNYFDLTGWLEDNFPERWAAGQAMGFTGTFAAR